jgi:hypothetical protein
VLRSTSKCFAIRDSQLVYAIVTATYTLRKMPRKMLAVVFVIAASAASMPGLAQQAPATTQIPWWAGWIGTPPGDQPWWAGWVGTPPADQPWHPRNGWRWHAHPPWWSRSVYVNVDNAAQYLVTPTPQRNGKNSTNKLGGEIFKSIGN